MGIKRPPEKKKPVPKAKNVKLAQKPADQKWFQDLWETNAEGLFSVNWEGNALGQLPQDLFPLITAYLRAFSSTQARGKIKEEGYALGEPLVTEPRIENPSGMAIDPYSGKIYVTARKKVKVFHPDGRTLSEFGAFGKHGSKTQKDEGDEALNTDWWPVALAVDEQSNLFVVHVASKPHVRVFDETYMYQRRFGGERDPSQGGTLSSTYGIAIDHQKNVLVCSPWASEVHVYSHAGVWLRVFGSGGFLGRPTAIAVDSQGNYVIGESGNERVQILRPDGYPLRTYPTGECHGICLDRDDNIITTTSPSTLQIISPSGQVTRVAENLPHGQLDDPRGVGIDRHGNILVVASSKPRILRFI